MSKGSKRRPRYISEAEWARRWLLAFGKRKQLIRGAHKVRKD